MVVQSRFTFQAQIIVEEKSEALKYVLSHLVLESKSELFIRIKISWTASEVLD